VVNCTECESPFCKDCFDDLHSAAKTKGHKTTPIEQPVASPPPPAASKKGSEEGEEDEEYEDDTVDADLGLQKPLQNKQKAPSAVAAASSTTSPSKQPRRASVVEHFAERAKQQQGDEPKSDYKKDAAGAVPASSAALCGVCKSSLAAIACDECNPKLIACEECDMEHHLHRERKQHKRKPMEAGSEAAPATPAAAPAGPAQLCELCELAPVTWRCATCPATMNVLCDDCDEGAHDSKKTSVHKREPVVAEAVPVRRSSVVEHFAARGRSAEPKANPFAASPSDGAVSAKKVAADVGPLCFNCDAATATVVCDDGCGMLCADCSSQLHARGPSQKHSVSALGPMVPAATPSAVPSSAGASSVAASPASAQPVGSTTGGAGASRPQTAASTGQAAKPSAVGTVQGSMGGTADAGESSSDDDYSDDD
jgi:hypothetical protein